MQQQAKKGKVSYFNQGQGYGFIDDGSPTQYYFRRSHILPEFRERSIFKGAEVEFVPEVGMSSDIAIKIRFLDSQPAVQQDTGDLAEQVENKVRQILNDALITGQTVLFKDLSDQLFEAFPGKGKLTDRLGVDRISTFFRNLSGVRITGQFPELYVELQDKRTFGRIGRDRASADLLAGQKAYLLEQVKACLISLAAGSEREGKPLDLTAVGEQLKERFPGDPVYVRLGFEKLGELIKAIGSLAIEREKGHDYLVLKGKPKAKTPAVKTPAVKTPVAKTHAVKTKEVKPPEVQAPAEDAAPAELVDPAELRAQAKAFIDEQIRAGLEANLPVEVYLLGAKLVEQFPGDRIYLRLGFKKLSQFINSFEAYDTHNYGPKQYLTFKGEESPLPPRPVQEESAPAPAPGNLFELREAVRARIDQILTESAGLGTPINLSTVYDQLAKSFPGDPVHKRFGFSKFASLVRSYPEFAIQVAEGGYGLLQRADPQDCAAAVQLRAEALAFIQSQLQAAAANGKAQAISTLDPLLKEAFPGALLQTRLGFPSFLEFLHSFPELQVIAESGFEIILPAGAPRPDRQQQDAADLKPD